MICPKCAGYVRSTEWEDPDGRKILTAYCPCGWFINQMMVEMPTGGSVVPPPEQPSRTNERLEELEQQVAELKGELKDEIRARDKVYEVSERLIRLEQRVGETEKHQGDLYRMEALRRVGEKKDKDGQHRQSTPFLIRDVITLQKEMRAAVERVDILSDQMDHRFGEHGEAIERLRQEIRSVAERVAALEAELPGNVSTAGEVEALRQRLSVLSDQVNNNTHNQSEIAREVIEMRNKLSSLTAPADRDSREDGGEEREKHGQ